MSKLEVNNTGNNSPIVLGKEAMKLIGGQSDTAKTKEQLINNLNEDKLFICHYFSPNSFLYFAGESPV